VSNVHRSLIEDLLWLTRQEMKLERTIQMNLGVGWHIKMIENMDELDGISNQASSLSVSQTVPYPIPRESATR
jgi:hypothetical protein